MFFRITRYSHIAESPDKCKVNIKKDWILAMCESILHLRVVYLQSYIRDLYPTMIRSRLFIKVMLTSSININLYQKYTYNKEIHEQRATENTKNAKHVYSKSK